MPITTSKQVIEELVLLRSEIAANRPESGGTGKTAEDGKSTGGTAGQARARRTSPPPPRQDHRGSAGADGLTSPALFNSTDTNSQAD